MKTLPLWYFFALQTMGANNNKDCNLQGVEDGPDEPSGVHVGVDIPRIPLQALLHRPVRLSRTRAR